VLLPIKNPRHRPLQISYTRLGQKNGVLRFWQEGLRLTDAGFEPGQSIRANPIPELSTLIIEAGEGGHTVSGRKNRYTEHRTPIIDINNRKLEETFGDARLLRTSYYKGKLVVQAHSQEMNRITALDDFKTNLRAGALSMGSICVGGGVCSTAIKNGAELEGARIESEWLIDIENKYLQSLLDNTSVASDRTTIIEGAIGDVEAERLSPVNVLNISLPCTGFSKSGRAKNRLLNPESHKTAGTAIIKTLEIIEKLMPPVIWNENVESFASSASADLMAGRLKELGYHVEVGVYGGEMGTLEDRKRSILVASHPSLSLSLESLVPMMDKEDCLNDVLETIPLDDSSWKPYDYLAAKELRDIAEGKGFRRQLLSGEEKYCGVLGAGYAKARSTEPFIQHPEKHNLSRLLTETEHARVMKNSPRLVANMSKKLAHEILGQSGSGALFTALGSWLIKESRRKTELTERMLYPKNNQNSSLRQSRSTQNETRSISEIETSIKEQDSIQMSLGVL